jgi:hypothetical protein
MAASLTTVSNQCSALKSARGTTANATSNLGEQRMKQKYSYLSLMCNPLIEISPICDFRSSYDSRPPRHFLDDAITKITPTTTDLLTTNEPTTCNAKTCSAAGYMGLDWYHGWPLQLASCEDIARSDGGAVGLFLQRIFDFSYCLFSSGGGSWGEVTMVL